jgi:hypothetical protein
MKSLDDILENLKTKKVHPFEPGLDIELYKQEELTEVQKNRVREKNPQNLDFPGNSLIRRDRNPCGERIILRNFLRRDPPRPRTGIEEINDKNDFIKWFDDKYDIPDGTYHGQYNFGGDRGYSWLFVFEVKHGSIKKSSWKKKSNGKARDRSSRYYALPYLFRERKKWNV